MAKRGFLSVAVVLVFLAGVVGAVDITSCTTITTAGYYRLVGDITNTTTPVCMNVSTDNVTLDCQGHFITHNYTASSIVSMAILVKNYSAAANNYCYNCSVMNCFVNGSNVTKGLSLTKPLWSVFSDNTIGGWQGKTGAAGANGVATCSAGAAGSASTGIENAGGAHNLFIRNKVHDIEGGGGGAGGNRSFDSVPGRFGCAGGAAGAAYGIDNTLFNGLQSQDNNWTDTEIVNVSQGRPGIGGWSSESGGRAGLTAECIAFRSRDLFSRLLNAENLSIINSCGGQASVGGRTTASVTKCSFASLYNGDGTAGSTSYGLYYGISGGSGINVNNFTDILISGLRGGAASKGASGNNEYAGSGATAGNAIAVYGLMAWTKNITVVDTRGGTAGIKGESNCGPNPGGYGGNATILRVPFTSTAAQLNDFNGFGVNGSLGTNGLSAGVGTAINFWGATAVNVTNSTFSNVANYGVYSQTDNSYYVNPTNNTLVNTSFDHFTFAWDDAYYDDWEFASCEPECNFTVAWFGRIAAIGNTTAVTLNASDNHSAQAYSSGLQSSPPFLAFDAAYNNHSTTLASYWWNAYNCSAESLMATCAAQGGNTCAADDGCENNAWLLASDTGYCCPTECEGTGEMPQPPHRPGYLWQSMYFNFSARDLMCALDFTVVTVAETHPPKPYLMAVDGDDDAGLPERNIYIPIALIFVLVVSVLVGGRLKQNAGRDNTDNGGAGKR